ncbi:hypothetical protein Tco_0237919 [Tanacetum coccineum]
MLLSQAYAKIPKLYRAYELCDKNEQLHVFDSEDTLEDAEKSRLKMNEFQNDEKVQELKIKLIDYEKLNKLYDDFVTQKELSAEQTYFSSSFISFEKVSSKTKPSMASMPSANLMLVDLNEMKNVFKIFFTLLELSKIIVELEKDLSKFLSRAKSSTFLQSHLLSTGPREEQNNFFEQLQKENENFMASLQIENAHLKLTYKDLFDSVQRSRVETNHCDEVKVNVNFVEIETKNIELEYQVNVNFLERQLARKRVETKLDNSSILGKPPLLNNERDQLLKQIASLESKLASQDIRSCQKEYHELRTSYNALKVNLCGYCLEAACASGEYRDDKKDVRKSG